MTELMVQSGVAPRERFTTIYSGLEVEPLLDSARHRLPTRQSLGYRPEQIVVGKVARLFPLKGHEDLIQAARRIVQVVPQVRFLLVGDGLLAGRLRDQIAAYGLEDHFQLTGLVPPEKIPILLSAMDIVVHASLREGLARVLPQALIAGKPVVSYDADGAREVVIPDQTGYLVPPQDVEGLVLSILKLAADPALRQRLGDEGRRRFTDLFRHQRTTAQLRTFYERLLCLRERGGVREEP